MPRPEFPGFVHVVVCSLLHWTKAWTESAPTTLVIILATNLPWTLGTFLPLFPKFCAISINVLSKCDLLFCFAPNPSPETCYGPNPVLRMYYAPYHDQKMCYAPDP